MTKILISVFALDVFHVSPPYVSDVHPPPAQPPDTRSRRVPVTQSMAGDPVNKGIHSNMDRANYSKYSLIICLMLHKKSKN